MADLTQKTPKLPGTILRHLDKAWMVFILILIGHAILASEFLLDTIRSTLGNLAHTGIFIAIATFLIAYLRATGAEAIVGKAFQGNQVKMVILASLVGGLAPFCSCEVIPFIAALLAMGTPLAAVMAFWLSSPIMDPPMFVITTAALGVDFAIAKTVAAVLFGLFGGGMVIILSRTGLFANPLREKAEGGCGSCCGSDDPFKGETKWAFWQEAPRVKTFRETFIENAAFLIKWMALAYLLEAIMIRFIPAEWIATAVGGDGVGPIFLGAILGGPAYLNGYAAAPLVAGLMEQGMSQGSAMAFMLAGSVTCIPAAVAVWALVKPRIFAAYIAFGFVASVIAGLVWSAVS